MNDINDKSVSTQKKLSKARIKLTLEGAEKYAKFGIATGLATTAFAILGAKNQWLDGETAAKIGLSGLGITCVSSIPFITKEIDGKEIARKLLTQTQCALSLGGN